MKLLTMPSYTIEEIEIGGDQEVTDFHPLGILGIGPVFSKRIVHSPVVKFPGRRTANPIQIDFESEYVDARYDEHPIVKRTLELEGFRIHGVFPMHKLHDNVWLCNMDHYEHLRHSTAASK